MLSFLIVDDHSTVRYGLSKLVKDAFGSTQINYARNGAEALDCLKAETVDVMLTDMVMPDTNPVEFIKAALQIKPELRVLVVSMNSEEQYAQRLLAAGAYGMVSKSEDDEALLNAIKSVGLGKRYVSEKVLLLYTKKDADNETGNPFTKLSERELQVTDLLLRGNGLLEIGNAMNITTSTASTYKNKIFQKLNINSVIGLAKLAEAHGITWGEQ